MTPDKQKEFEDPTLAMGHVNCAYNLVDKSCTCDLENRRKELRPWIEAYKNEVLEEVIEDAYSLGVADADDVFGLDLVNLIDDPEMSEEWEETTEQSLKDLKIKFLSSGGGEAGT